MNAGAVTLLLVEDDEVDATTVRRGLERAGIHNPLVRAKDGIEALELLQGVPGRPPLPPPYLLLVDVRMPRLDGLSLIRRIRGDARLRQTVVFVLTTSDSERDRAAAAQANVAGFIQKSIYPHHFATLAKMIEDHLSPVTRPARRQAG